MGALLLWGVMGSAVSADAGKVANIAKVAKCAYFLQMAMLECGGAASRYPCSATGNATAL
jgi:hypothetical protein